jgi:hypothetical protein
MGRELAGRDRRRLCGSHRGRTAGRGSPRVPNEGCRRRSPRARLRPVAVNLFLFDLGNDAPTDALDQPPPFFGVARIGQERRYQRRATRRKRPSCRPYMQRRNMPVPDILLMHGVQRRLFERKRAFNEACNAIHSVSPAAPCRTIAVEGTGSIANALSRSSICREISFNVIVPMVMRSRPVK